MVVVDGQQWEMGLHLRTAGREPMQNRSIDESVPELLFPVY